MYTYTKRSTNLQPSQTHQAFPDIAAALPPKQVTIPKLPPPNKRFLELQSPADLKLGEVRELLREHRRMAVALKNLGAFDSK